MPSRDAGRLRESYLPHAGYTLKWTGFVNAARLKGRNAASAWQTVVQVVIEEWAVIRGLPLVLFDRESLLLA